MAVGQPVSRAGMQRGDGPGTERCQEGKRSVWEHKSLLSREISLYGMPVMGGCSVILGKGRNPTPVLRLKCPPAH